MYTLIPRSEHGKPYVLRQPEWAVVCAAAGMTGRQREYTAEQCVRVAGALRQNPNILDLPDGRRADLLHFLETCDGVMVL